MTLPPAQTELLRHIAQATQTWARSGSASRTFLLLYLGGLQSTIEHPGWDSSWPTPSEHDIDDLAELASYKSSRLTTSGEALCCR